MANEWFWSWWLPSCLFVAQSSLNGAYFLISRKHIPISHKNGQYRPCLWQSRKMEIVSDVFLNSFFYFFENVLVSVFANGFLEGVLSSMVERLRGHSDIEIDQSMIFYRLTFYKPFSFQNGNQLMPPAQVWINVTHDLLSKILSRLNSVRWWPMCMNKTGNIHNIGYTLDRIMWISDEVRHGQ